jgi:hypothetical protein
MMNGTETVVANLNRPQPRHLHNETEEHHNDNSAMPSTDERSGTASSLQNSIKVMGRPTKSFMISAE